MFFGDLDPRYGCRKSGSQLLLNESLEAFKTVHKKFQTAPGFTGGHFTKLKRNVFWIWNRRNFFPQGSGGVV